jgi:hypothetical protein
MVDLIEWPIMDLFSCCWPCHEGGREGGRSISQSVSQCFFCFVCALLVSSSSRATGLGDGEGEE